LLPLRPRRSSSTPRRRIPSLHILWADAHPRELPPGQAVTDWDERQAEALSSAGGARAQIERLRSARDAGWNDASRLGGLIDEVIEALGVEHSLVAELTEARDLALFESPPSSDR
jgi:hypothetical protein